MKYSDMIGRAFRGMRSGALWWFSASATALRIVAMLASLAAFYALGDTGLQRIATSLTPWQAGGGASPVLAQVGYIAAIVIGSVLALPINLTLIGGLTHLSDNVLTGRDTSAADGWRVGGQRMGRIFVIQFLLGLITFGVAFAAAIPLLLAVVAGAGFTAAGASGGNFNPVPLVLGVCCGYLLFLLLLVLAAVFLGAVGSIAARYAIIGERTSGDAFGAAWTAVRARWKNVFVFSLIVFGFGMLWLAVGSIVLVPLSFVMGSNARGATLSHLLTSYAVTFPVTVILAIPLMVFTYLLWTAFFRQLTGLDAADTTPPAYSAPSYPYPEYAPGGPGYVGQGDAPSPYPPYAPYEQPESAEQSSTPPLASQPTTPAELGDAPIGEQPPQPPA